MARRAAPALAAADSTMVIAVASLLVIGLVMVMSASSVTSHLEYGDPYAYAKRQLLWAFIGLVAMGVLSRMPYQMLQPLALPGLLLSVLLLVVVLVAGAEAGGSRRWLAIGGLNLQPSELAKVALVNYLAAFAAARQGDIEHFWRGLLPALAVAAVPVGLIFLEPDFGTAACLLATAILVIFAAGARIGHLVAIGLAVLPVAGFLVWSEPYRWRRIMAFIDPWSDKMDSGWNVIQSLLAIGSGGLFGLGLGEGRQKYLYVPEQHTDFIFAILGEELGFIGAGLVVFLFFVVAWRGYRAALQAPDLFGCLLAAGLTSMIVFQALLNIGVVTGSLPVTGITLPFISFGGSSLVMTLASVGILLNISRQGGRTAGASWRGVREARRRVPR